jgi:hypothetical protein
MLTASNRISGCIFLEHWSAKSYCVAHLMHGRNQKAERKNGKSYRKGAVNTISGSG